MNSAKLNLQLYEAAQPCPCIRGYYRKFIAAQISVITIHISAVHVQAEIKRRFKRHTQKSNIFLQLIIFLFNI